MQWVVERPLAWLIAYGDSIASQDHTTSFYAAVAKRLEGMPIAYITGRQAFWSLELEVTPAVLIPRADTETLVEAALKRIPQDQPSSVLDLGTGSGAIALSLAKERASAQITAIDKSPAALAVAIRNAERLGIDSIIWLESDWLSAVTTQRFDCVVSNPPYVAANDPHLQQDGLPFEPDVALIGRDDGLGDIKHIIEHARSVLRPGGWLLIEHGFDQGEAVTSLFEHYSYNDIRRHKDLNQQNRCTEGRLP